MPCSLAINAVLASENSTKTVVTSATARLSTSKAARSVGIVGPTTAVSSAAMKTATNRTRISRWRAAGSLTGSGGVMRKAKVTSASLEA